MEIIEIKENKKDFLSLLLLADEQESMIDKYIEKCDFSPSHIIKNFFIDNYDKPIYENGIQLIDMIYLQRKL